MQLQRDAYLEENVIIKELAMEYKQLFAPQGKAYMLIPNVHLSFVVIQSFLTCVECFQTYRNGLCRRRVTHSPISSDEIVIRLHTSVIFLKGCKSSCMR